MNRASGVLMHFSSLPNKYGIGGFGKESYDFVDFLKRSNQTYWQVLPIGPTSYGDSPYQSFSTFAGNPYFISLEDLFEEGLLTEEELAKAETPNNGRVDYGYMFDSRFSILRAASNRFFKNTNEEYLAFIKDNAFWLDDYSMYGAIKYIYKCLPWTEWPDGLKNREKGSIELIEKKFKKEINFWKFVQFEFFKQYFKLKKYANDNGVQIIGDMPIYVALDSADVWSKKQLFEIDDNCNPKLVAGVPPDAFSDDGQLWGNPLYNWKYMAEDNYSWWINRIDYATRIFDVIRIDHFRGFDSYYAIPFGDTNAKNGKWIKGPGMKLFNEVKKALPDRKIIAEDLGILTDSVRDLLKKTGYPGMKVFQFGLDSKDPSNEYMPHNYAKDVVAYIGTHDNDTIVGWRNNTQDDIAWFAREYMNVQNDNNFAWDAIRTIMRSSANICIITCQDILSLGSEARMNAPSIASGNWQWRLMDGQLTFDLQNLLGRYTYLYGRVNKN